MHVLYCSSYTLHDKCGALQNDLQILRTGHSIRELLDMQNDHRYKSTDGREEDLLFYRKNLVK